MRRECGDSESEESDGKDWEYSGEQSGKRVGREVGESGEIVMREGEESVERVG